MTIDSGRSLSIRKLSYLSWLITPCCGWTDCQEWICFYKHPVSVLHLTDVLGMSFSCLDLLCLKKKLKTFLLIMRVFFSHPFAEVLSLACMHETPVFLWIFEAFFSRFNVR